MKIALELNCTGNKRFLNFWDSEHGNDICCEIVYGKLVLRSGDGRNITLNEFIKRVIEAAGKETV